MRMAAPFCLRSARPARKSGSMLIRLALALFALLLPLSAHAQSLAGSWDLRVEGATVFRFEIEEGLDGEWLGQWQRPQQFNSNGNAFYNMRGGVKTTPSMTGILFLDMVELAFDDPRPGAIPDIFRFRLTGPDSAEMIYVGTDLAPYAMVRAAPGTPIGDWDATRVYRRTLAGPQNDGQLERVVPGVSFSLGGPAPAPVAAEAPVPEPVEPAPVEEPAPTAPVSRIGRDFLEGL